MAGGVKADKIYWPEKTKRKKIDSTAPKSRHSPSRTPTPTKNGLRIIIAVIQGRNCAVLPTRDRSKDFPHQKPEPNKKK